MRKIFKEEDVIRIGRELASIWCANLDKTELDIVNDRYIFWCSGHDGEFYTTMTFDEIEEELTTLNC